MKVIYYAGLKITIEPIQKLPGQSHDCRVLIADHEKVWGFSLEQLKAHKPRTSKIVHARVLLYRRLSIAGHSHSEIAKLCNRSRTHIQKTLITHFRDNYIHQQTA